MAFSLYFANVCVFDQAAALTNLHFARQFSNAFDIDVEQVEWVLKVLLLISYFCKIFGNPFAKIFGDIVLLVAMQLTGNDEIASIVNSFVVSLKLF